MKKHILLLLLIHAFCLSFGTEKIKFEQLGFEEGLSQISIRALYQDENGIIWVGTNEGLKKYNGNNFEEIPIISEDNISYLNTIHIICGDHQGHLYLKTNLNTIVEYDLHKETSRLIYKEPNDKASLVINYGKNNLWISVQNQIFKYQNGKMALYKTLSKKDAVISAIIESSDGKIYVGTKKSGVCIVEPSKKELELVSQCSEIVSIFEDSHKCIWIGTWIDGLYLSKPNSPIKQFRVNGNKNQTLSNNYVRAMCEDNDGNIWIGTIEGLDKLNIKTQQISHYGISKQKNYRLSHPSVWSLIKDNQGTIWVATYYGGVNYFNPTKEIFSFYNFSDINATTEYPIISKIAEDNKNNLWIGTEGKGLFFFNKETDKIINYTEGKNSISRNIIKSLYYDKQKGLLWIGTHLGGLNCLNIKTNKISHVNINSRKGSILTQAVQVIEPYKDYLYLGTLAGIYRYNTTTGKIDQEKQLAGRFSVINDLLFDESGSLWIASNGLYRYNLKTKKLKSFHQILKYSNASTHTLVNDLYQDSKKRIWIGTSSAGVALFNPLNNDFIEFNKQNSGLESNYISSIFESNSGSILVGTNKGLSFIDVKQHKSFNYNSKNGFPLHSMMSGCIFKRHNGELALGGINGVCFFREESLLTPEKNYRMRFDKLWINNKLVMPNDQTKVLKAAMPYTNKIILSHQQNNIAIEFATDNYIKKNQPNFQYKLEPYNEEWINFDLKTPINYMNLPSGSYILKVRRTILHEIDPKNEIDLEIVVRPPLYATWYAYLTYIIITLLIVKWIISFYRSRLILQTSLIFERKDKEQKELANQSKLQFFTNISHELRTPLTLIVSQLELLLQSTKNATSQYKEIINVYRNAQNMIRLINELLDFRKQEEGFMELKVSNNNIVDFMREIYVSFIDFAHSRKITYTLHSNSGEIDILFDYTQLQKVFYNLISNAFKYTSNEGKIGIEIKEDSSYVTISVMDNGVGISEKSKERVFEQFYQDGNSNAQNLRNPGTGLGLALSKGIVELHCGKIEVISQEGAGSVFTVTLYKGDSHFANKKNIEIIEKKDIKGENAIDFSIDDSAFLEKATITQKENFQELPTILIVEDDDDLRNVLSRIFSPMYKVLEAKNGLIGYSQAKENQPNLIVSDIMMPVMDGNEMCSKIKSDFETCHIPVVLLTAQTTIEQNIDGLKSGADDFISKPFNIKLLIMRCNNLLNGRKILQEKYTREIDTSPQKIVYNTFDKQFIENAVRIIENNTSNRKINVDFLCSEMAIGRRVFFNKMKSITGQTPNDFILTVKFKVAASMLKNNPEMNISEISDVLGFSSSKYFSKCFKMQFGVSPMQMRYELINKK